MQINDGGSTPATANHSAGTVSPRQARLAVSAIFLVNGAMLASWIARIPTIANDLDLSSGRVGTALMAIAAGALLSFSIAGRVIDTRSSKTSITLFGLILLGTLPLIGLAPNLLVLMPILFVLGFGNGGMDVSMNAQGVEVERQGGTSIMSSLHGFWSLGGFLGAATGAGAAHLGLHPTLHFAIVAAVGLAILLVARRGLIPDAPDARAEEPSPIFALPHRSIWLLGALGVCAAIGEGAMGDWSGLYLHDYLGTTSAYAALGFATFSVFMLIGRFSGDRLVERFGAPTIIRFGGSLAAVGLGVATLINQPPAMLLGFGAVGLGLSAVYPLVFSAAGNHPTLPRGRAVASVATVGYSGFLAGPPILGWIAQATSLRVIMVVVVLLAAAAALLSRATTTATAHEAPGVAHEPKTGLEPLS